MQAMGMMGAKWQAIDPVWCSTLLKAFFVGCMLPVIFLGESQNAKTVASLYPFFIVFYLVLVFDLSSKYVAPFALLVTVYLGMNVFRDSWKTQGWDKFEALGRASYAIIDGFVWCITDYGSFAFAAVFLNYVLQQWGVLRALGETMVCWTNDPIRQCVIIMLGLGIALAVVAPGGTNFLIAASVLIEIEKRRLPPEMLQVAVQKAGAVILFGNALSSAFNLLGVCIKANAEQIAEQLLEIDPTDSVGTRQEISKQFGGAFGLQFLVFATVSPLIIATLYAQPPAGSKRVFGPAPGQVSPRDILVLLVTGLVFGVFQYATAAFVGPELPCLISGMAVILTMFLAEKIEFTRSNEWRGFTLSEPQLTNPIAETDPVAETDKPTAPHSPLVGDARPTPHTTLWERMRYSQHRYMLPFGLLTVVLAVVAGVNATVEDLPSWIAIGITDKRSFPWLVHGALWVSVVAVATPYLISRLKFADTSHPPTLGGAAVGLRASYRELQRKQHLFGQLLWQRLRKEQVNVVECSPEQASLVLHRAMAKAWTKASGVLVSISSYAAIAKVMVLFGMTSHIADLMVDGMRDSPDSYAAIIPILGLVGAGLVGSSTTATFLFAQLQIRTAFNLGLLDNKNSAAEVAALQLLGASAGEIISPSNAIMGKIFCNTNKIDESDPDIKEGHLIKSNLPVFVFWIIGGIVVSFIALSF